MKKMILLFSMIFVVVMALGVVSAKNCTVKEDCYSSPVRVVPPECGDVYSCLNGQCVVAAVDCVTPSNLSDYYNGINYSCQQDSDCVIKDLHNCCGVGYHCVNKNAFVYPDFVEAQCVKEEVAVNCDKVNLPEACECENDKCVEKENASDTSCKNLYWFDNDNKNCSQKQFCGLYMYLGLQTFASKTQCLKAVNPEENKSCSNEADCKVTSCGDCINKNQEEIKFCERPPYELPYTISCECKSNKCESVRKNKSETSCTKDEDCACGVHITTGECFTGNKNYVDTDPSKVCPDFCGGFAGNFITKCVENKCGQIDATRSLCDKKEDCKVVFNKCTCKYQCERIGQNYTETVCDKYVCSEESKEKTDLSCKCNNNVCVEGKNKFCDSEENNKCYKNLSNGRKAEIKIMPETASAKAIERLGELGFNITLKEVGKDKVVYELTGNKQGKFLGIFKIMARVKAQVDAETGDVKVIKPWWAFLASGV